MLSTIGRFRLYRTNYRTSYRVNFNSCVSNPTYIPSINLQKNAEINPATTMNGIFAVNKPSGPTSHDIVHKIRDLFVKSPLFEADVKKNRSARNHGKKFRRDRLPPIKVGHGGTLDPLADGVLVIGVGTGTKKLPDYLGNCKKVYQATALLGATTDSYDSEGKLIGRGNTDNITNEMVEAVLPKLRGEIHQIPPIYSALKMGGKKLYDYARSGEPLPREIEARKVNIYELDVVNGGLVWDHNYLQPQESASDEEKKLSIQFEENTIQSRGLAPPNLIYDGSAVETSKPAPILEIRFSVSSGTYIRTIIHDLGLALGCGAHMVKLTRLQQADWKLSENVFELSDFTKHSEDYWGPPLTHYLNSGPGVSIKSLFPKEEVSTEAEETTTATAIATPAKEESTDATTSTYAKVEKEIYNLESK